MINLKRKNNYVNDFINDFENEIKNEIFETDELAEQFYINKYGMEKNKSAKHGFILSNSMKRICPKKLTKKQKMKLLLLLKKTQCEANIYMSYQDILLLKKDTN